MSKTTILLVRHGQSMGNIEGVFTGHTGHVLSDLGLKQAAMTADYLYKNYKVDAVYSSDLPRAFQTAEPTAQAFGLPIVTDARFREINVGEWDRKPFAHMLELYPEDYTVWMEDLIHARCTGGESVLEVAERVMDGINAFAAANPDKCVVVVTHATPLRCALWKISGAPESAIQDMSWGGNCAVSELVCVDGKFEIVSLNYMDHLSGFASALPSNV